MNRNLKTRTNNGFTIVELIVVVTVIGLLATIAVGAYNKVVNNAKVTKSSAPDSNFAIIAPYIRMNGAQPTVEADLLAKSGMPSTVKVTLGTVDDSSFQGSNPDQAPTVTGYGL